MPTGVINALAGWGATIANHICARLSDAVVHNTRDFAEHSKFLSSYLDKLTVIHPPIVVDQVSSEEIDQFLKKYEIDPSRKIIGMVARLASEKGVEYLVAAMPNILQVFEDSQVVFVGNYQDVIGESAYKEKVMPMIRKLGDRWKFLGIISDIEKSAFYNICDVLVLPSINSTESLGMVQVEGMICGVSVVATDLPGVRRPVQSTGMGKIVPIKNSQALAKGIIEVLQSSAVVDEASVNSLKGNYSPESVARAYEALYENLLERDE
jgi:glycosyltransferase involved in cell wall biosynthesis